MAKTKTEDIKRWPNFGLGQALDDNLRPLHPAVIGGKPKVSRKNTGTRGHVGPPVCHVGAVHAQWTTRQTRFIHVKPNVSRRPIAVHRSKPNQKKASATGQTAV